MSGDECFHCGGTGKRPVKVLIVTTPGEESGFLERMHRAADAAAWPGFEFVDYDADEGGVTGKSLLLDMDFAELEAKVAAQYSGDPGYMGAVAPKLSSEGPSPDNHKRKHRSKGRNRREW